MNDWKKWDGPLEVVSTEWFVNRSEHLERFWDWATRIPKSFGSQALIGLRRTGKIDLLDISSWI